MPPHNRPDAFSVSYPEEKRMYPTPSPTPQPSSSRTTTPGRHHPRSSSSRPSLSSHATSSRPNSQKRSRSPEGSSRPKTSSPSAHRSRLHSATPPISSFQRRVPQSTISKDSESERPAKRARRTRYFAPENVRIIREGALNFIEEEDGENRSTGDDKPVRTLTSFSFFDKKTGNTLVSLSCLEVVDGIDRNIVGAGFVKPVVIDGDDEEVDDEDLDETIEPVFVELDAVFSYTTEYNNELTVWIQTERAWYRLVYPSKDYAETWDDFAAPRIETFLCLEEARSTSPRSVEIFKKDEGLSLEEPTITELTEVLEQDEYKALRHVSLIKKLVICKSTKPHDRTPAPAAPRRNRVGLGNLEASYLKNQKPTRVTPLIATLVDGYISEKLHIVGPRPEPKKKSVVVSPVLQKVIQRVPLRAAAKIAFSNARTQYREEMTITYSVQRKDTEKIKVGDVVIVVPDNTVIPQDLSSLNHSDRIEDWFWFAIVWKIDSRLDQVHLVWFNHGKKVVLREFAHPKELFFHPSCDDVDIRAIVGKLNVRFVSELPPADEYDDSTYYCRFQFDSISGSFTTRPDPFLPRTPCTSCNQKTARESGQHPVTKDCKYRNQVLSEIVLEGVRYHISDFVLYTPTETGRPADIGQIEKIDDFRGGFVSVRRLGRLSSVNRKHLGRDFNFIDERELYMTSELTEFDAKYLCHRLAVVHPDSFHGAPVTMEEWLALSPLNFFVRYRFPRLRVSEEDMKSPVTLTGDEKLTVCGPCTEEWLQDLPDLLKFKKATPLRTLDLFGGVGAFSKSLAEGAFGLKVTHAIEISPSACATFQRNSPETVVYNQCANVMLEHIIKLHRQKDTDTPESLSDSRPVPKVFKKGEIDAIVAGFPCQSHSGLNRFKKSNDTKSNLILTTLSYVDLLRPKVCYFENVPGFLKYRLNAIQSGRHRLDGGIELGGLKLLTRALLEMNYQVRFGLLQAGQYGCPQGRIRFFCIATQRTVTLPLFPTPTHHFNSKSLAIPLEYDAAGKPSISSEPFNFKNGGAAHPAVTIKDATSDLPLWDWKLPTDFKSPKDDTKRLRKRIPVLAPRDNEPFVGYRGNSVRYEHEPRTSFQKHCRANPTQDLQHITRVFLPKKIAQVIHVPLKPGADYRALPPDLGDFQFANPMSALGRADFRPGLFGRLDPDGFFSTTVTNMHPTAKQSKVLHPHCRRMLTVRELARSQGFRDDFVFESISPNDVVTMHRQIGNAVPWPVGVALGRELRKVLFEKWKEQERDAIVID